MNAKNSNRLALLLVALSIILPASIPLASAAASDRRLPPPPPRESCAAERAMEEYRTQYTQLAELRDARVGVARQSGPNTFANSLAAWEPAFEALEDWRDNSMRRAARTDSLTSCTA